MSEQQHVPCPDPNEMVTRAILREELSKELSNYPTKEDLKNELAKYPTKEDLKNELAKFGEDIGRRLGAMQETIISQVIAMQDPYRDYPVRIEDHERRIVLLETPKPAKRRARPTTRRRRRR